MRSREKKILGVLVGAALFMSVGCGKMEVTGEQESVRGAESFEAVGEVELPEGIVTDESLPVGEVDLSGIDQGNYPIVDGSTATLPLSQSLYAQVTGVDMEEATRRIVHSKTTASYHNLIEGKADLLIVGEANDDTVEAAKEQGVNLLSAPIALDAFVFMVNEDNPVKSLTLDQIVDIYAGNVTNWSQVGGSDQPIVAFQRNEGAGSQTLMEEMVMKDTPMVEAPSMVATTMMSMLTAIASYNNMENAIGYSVFYYAGLMEQTPGLRFMGVEGQVPSAQTISDGSYPLISRYYAVIREDEPKDSPARRLYDYLRSPKGQQLVQSDGYVPFTAPMEEAAAPLPSGTLPIGEDEGLLLCLGDFKYVVMDRHFQILGQVNSVLRSSLSRNDITQKSEIISLDEPLIFYTLPAMLGLEEDEPQPKADDPNVEELPDYGEDWRAGLYHPLTGTWITEPTHLGVFDMGEGLYALTDVGKDDKSDTQITIIDAAGQELAVYQNGRVIETEYYYDSPGYLLLPDGIYRASGELVVADPRAMMMEYALPTCYAIRENGEYEYRDWTGKAIPLKEGSSSRGLADTETGQMEIWHYLKDGVACAEFLDADRQVVMDIHKFLEINQEYTDQTDLSDACFIFCRYDKETGCYLFECRTKKRFPRYLVVDKDFIIQRDYISYPGDLVLNTQNGAVSAEDIWTGETEIFHVDKSDFDTITKLGEDMYFFSPVNYENPEGALYRKDELVVDQLAGYEETENGIICVRTYAPNQGLEAEFYTSSGCYVNDTGQVVLPREGCVIRYFDEEYYCYTEGEYAYFMDYQGNLYLRIPVLQ
jgi:ABC-type phosphate transport system substrate-binding protein